MKQKELLISIVLISILLSLAWFAYKPGFSGGFIFDDYHSLKKLAIIDGNPNLQNSLDYLKSSDTGPLKRPISVFSFLLDSQDWPASAYSFKRTNVILHLVCGFLLFILVALIMHYKGAEKKYFIAFCSTGFWLLHPFLVSTTLYIVQRMAILPLFFMLLGMIVYLLGRKKYAEAPSLKNQAVLMIAVFGGTFLAMLSKENGVLFLPLMALFEGFIVVKFLNYKVINKKLRLLLFTLPICLLVIGLIIKMPSFLNGYDVRDFDLYERQLSQFRALSDYIYHLLIPKYFTYGVFTDGFAASRSLFNPITTFISLVFIVLLLVWAWINRNKYIWISFTVFFFFIAHSLESTFLPLELYFEHRNYVASLFIGVPISMGLLYLTRKSEIFYLIPLILLGYLVFLTHLRSNLWGNNYNLHAMTMVQFPESIRAKNMTADFFARKGDEGMTMMILNQAIDKHEDLSLQLKRLDFLCNRESATHLHYQTYFDQLFDAFKTVRFTQEEIVPYTILLRKLLTNSCGTQDDMGFGTKLYESLALNPAMDRLYLQILNDVYGMHHLIETEQYEKVEPVIIKIVQEHGRYKDAFQGLNSLIGANQMDSVIRLLDIIDKQYQIDFKGKLELQNIGLQIQAYYELLESKK